MEFAQQVALMAVVFAVGVLAGWFFACVVGRGRTGLRAGPGGSTGLRAGPGGRTGLRAGPGGSGRRAAGASGGAERVVALQERAAEAAAEAREAYAQWAAPSGEPR
jgi:hypothetical protein